MTTIRRIPTSKIDGNGSNSTNTSEVRPYGEIAVYVGDNNKLELLMFDGVRTHLRSKVLNKGTFYGGDADSGDGNNRDTIKLIPDAELFSNDENYNNDQYVIIDPTVGDPVGHIHIRAGGSIDQSTADLFLGGERNNVRVSDTDDRVIITTDAGEGTRTWTFDNSGDLTFPGATSRIGESEPGLVVFSNNGFAVLTNANAVSNYQVEFTGYVSNGFGDSPGATLTVTEVIAGTITDGMTIYGSGLPEEGWTVTFGSGVMEPQGSGGTGNYLLSGANILTSSQSFNDGVTAAGSQVWVFSQDGALTLPGGAAIVADESNLEIRNVSNFNVEATGVVNIYADANGSAHQWQFGDDGNLTLPASGDIRSANYGGFSLRSLYDEPFNGSLGGGIYISAAQISVNYQVQEDGAPVPGYQWDFNYVTKTFDLADGGLKFSDNSVQTTAVVQGEYTFEFDGVNTDVTITDLNFNLLYARTAIGYSGSDTHNVNLPAGTPGQRLVVVNVSVNCILTINGISQITVASGPAEFIYSANDNWISMYGTV